jgi:hypothetical protein
MSKRSFEVECDLRATFVLDREQVQTTFGPWDTRSFDLTAMSVVAFSLGLHRGAEDAFT